MVSYYSKNISKSFPDWVINIYNIFHMSIFSVQFTLTRSRLWSNDNTVKRHTLLQSESVQPTEELGCNYDSSVWSINTLIIALGRRTLAKPTEASSCPVFTRDPVSQYCIVHLRETMEYWRLFCCVSFIWPIQHPGGLQKTPTSYWLRYFHLCLHSQKFVNFL